MSITTQKIKQMLLKEFYIHHTKFEIEKEQFGIIQIKCYLLLYKEGHTDGCTDINCRKTFLFIMTTEHLSYFVYLLLHF